MASASLASLTQPSLYARGLNKPVMAPWLRLVRMPVRYKKCTQLYLTLTGPRAVAQGLRWLENEEVEVFVVLLLNAQYQLIACEEVARGILDSALVHPREVFRFAIAYGAASLILVHNHPSGTTTPSPDDRALTRQMVDGGNLLHVRVHDHIIIGADGTWLSFAEAGFL